MGFKDSTVIIDKILSIGKVNTATGRDQDDRQVVYIMNDEIDRHDSFAAGQQFDAVFIDVTSQLAGPGFSARTGADVRDWAQALIDEHVNVLGARRIVLCFDMRDRVSSGKAAERAARAKMSSRYRAPYERTVELKNASATDTSPQVEVMLADYEYAIDACMPDDYSRVMMTRGLLGKFSAFVAEIFESCITLPAVDGLSVVVSGFEKRNAQNLLCGEYTTRQRTVCVADDGTVTTTAMELKSCRAGEGEVQCIYWWRRWLETRAPASAEPSAMLVANDTDLIALGLMHVDSMSHAAIKWGSVFVNYSYVRANKRFVDIGALYANLRKQLGGTKPVRNDVQILLLGFALSGTDYCARIPWMGSGKFSKLIVPALIDPLRTRSRAIMNEVDASCGDWIVDEQALMAFLIGVFASQKFCEDALKHGCATGVGGQGVEVAYARCKEWRKGARGNPKWLVEPNEQVEFFSCAHACSVAHAELLAKPDSKGKVRKGIIVPPYDEARAHVRRAFYWWHYFATGHLPAAFIDAMAATPSGTSLFGYSGAAFAERVHTEDDATGLPVQPFLRCNAETYVGPHQRSGKRALEQ